LNKNCESNFPKSNTSKRFRDVLRFGYNTNGFAHHRLEDVVPLLAELGYESVAITLDHYSLNPFDKNLHRQMGEIRDWLEVTRLRCVVETGARFLLDRKRKHQPTLVSPNDWERQYRLEYLRRAIWIAEALGAECVSFWSGTPIDDASPDEIWQRLVEGCKSLLELADSRKVNLAFEPEPGMLVDTTAGYDELLRKLDHHPRFGLTLDIGHLHCQSESIIDAIKGHRERLSNVHIEDMNRGVHDHLFFGEGEIDFPPVLQALEDIGYRGGVYVELSRHSHDAVQVAKAALQFLRKAARSE
jgi:sugar phosphate isomerase/epimerase